MNPNTGNPTHHPCRSKLLGSLRSIEITKPQQYQRGVFRNKVTGAEHGPMIVRVDTLQKKFQKKGA